MVGNRRGRPLRSKGVKRTRAVAVKKKIERAGNLLEAVLEGMTEGVFAVDLSGRIASFSPGAERITGYEAAEVAGRRCEQIFRGARCGKTCPVKQVWERGTSVHNVEIEIAVKGDARKLIREHVAPLYGGDNLLVGAVVVFEDRSTMKQLAQEVEERYGFDLLIGKSRPMRRVYECLESVVETDAPVLIQGAAGTGKDLVARVLHYNGRRREGPFVAVNCAALPGPLLESELFGYERGAFSGAIQAKAGRFELAQGGTLFLDEIGGMGPRVQEKLVEVLDTSVLKRVGGEQSVRIEVRVLSASNEDLEKAAEEGRFSEALYVRLGVPIKLPPLSERVGDIPLLVDHFIRMFDRKMGKQVKSVSPETMRILSRYTWPENVRELEHTIEVALAHSKGEAILPEHLPDALRQWAIQEENALGQLPGEEDESELLRRTLAEVNGNRGETARRLGISRPTLWRKMKKYGLL